MISKPTDFLFQFLVATQYNNLSKSEPFLAFNSHYKRISIEDYIKQVWTSEVAIKH